MNPRKRIPRAPTGVNGAIPSPYAWNLMADRVELADQISGDGSTTQVNYTPAGKTIIAKIPKVTRMKLTSNYNNGTYKAKTTISPILGTTTNLIPASFGTLSAAENAVFWNENEVSFGGNAIDLTDDGQIFTHGYFSGVLDIASGLPIFIGRIVPEEDCAGGSAQSYTTTIGDGSSTTFTITHSLGTRQLTFSFMDNGTNAFVYPAVSAPTTNTLSVVFSGAPPTSGQFTILVNT